MRRYRIQIWSRDQAKLIDHDAIPTGEASGEALLERLAAAGRAAFGRPLRRPDDIATASGHLREALRLLDGS